MIFYMNLIDVLASALLIAFGYFLNFLTNAYIENRRYMEEKRKEAIQYYRENLDIIRPYLEACNRVTYGATAREYAGDVSHIKKIFFNQKGYLEDVISDMKAIQKAIKAVSENAEFSLFPENIRKSIYKVGLDVSDLIMYIENEILKNENHQEPYPLTSPELNNKLIRVDQSIQKSIREISKLMGLDAN